MVADTSYDVFFKVFSFFKIELNSHYPFLKIALLFLALPYNKSEIIKTSYSVFPLQISKDNFHFFSISMTVFSKSTKIGSIKTRDMQFS